MGRFLRSVFRRSFQDFRADMVGPALSKLWFVGFVLLAVSLLLLGQSEIGRAAQALLGDAAPSQASPLHPVFPLLDEDGENVLVSGKPLSTMQSCGNCHDTEFIAEHSLHADLGLSSLGEPGSVADGESWAMGPGAFGNWDPFSYRYLSPPEDALLDLTTPDWVRTLGARHVGGGPAQYSRDGRTLTELTPDATNPETALIDPASGEAAAWNWDASGIVEMNCFLCHLPDPNNQARIDSLARGNFGQANTLTLLGTGIVTGSVESWAWDATAFDENGNLRQALVTVQDPSSQNCGQCHGEVEVESREPLTLDSCAESGWTTQMTGQIYSPQRINDSGLNISGKQDLSLAWDVHAERMLNCTDCHYSLNNPVYYEEDEATKPDHLLFDPRRIDMGDYLYRPLHAFAGSDNDHTLVDVAFGSASRSCESCHTGAESHDWLPFADRHMTALTCESCHVPQLYAPSVQSLDRTVINLSATNLSTTSLSAANLSANNGTNQSGSNETCQGVESADASLATSLITPYSPTLLPQRQEDGRYALAPYTLNASWFWVYGPEEAERPVPERDLQAAWLAGDGYRGDVLASFDHNGDGALTADELTITTDEQESLIRQNLMALGLENPRIVGRVQSTPIHHGVATGKWALATCESCHSEDSIVTQPVALADQMPGGVMPVWSMAETDAQFNGEVQAGEDGSLRYVPLTASLGDNPDLYILGHDSVGWIDWAGIGIFLATLLGVTLHGGLRAVAARRRMNHAAPALKEVYMYSFYERFWHWLQTAVILGLIFTGLIIHKPNLFGIFSFQFVVEVHNILAAVLLINAALAAFYHFASGEIKQFLPQPQGFFNQALTQASFYLRGIFRGEEHPFAKSRERKLNPLQQLTYLAILNVLLPLQVITGILMWGAQRWPGIAESVGGLAMLGPFHSLIAWLFATFIIMHVYLTTTGHTPLAGIRAMIVGWDEVEAEHKAENEPHSQTGDAVSSAAD